MNPAQRLANFDRISDAPDAIPRLRQFILELAVRGKLVERESNDEPASELLGRIRAEKDRRTKGGQLKKQEPLPQVRPDEAWFGVPANWQWVRLGTITQVLMGQSPPGETYNKTGEGIPLINGPVEFTEGPFGKTVVNQYTTDPTNLCEEGDLLLCVRGSTTGRTNIAGFKACIGRGVAAIRPFFADQYVRLFIWRMRESIIAMGRGIAFPSVSRQQIEELPVPLPPLAEQHRIVAKVDELMALCDRLEAAQAERESRRDRLAAASLHRLNQPADTDAPEVFREHARFCLNHLPRLTTRPEQIKQIRQTILNLAVRGQLVAQDPKDEPASELLQRIHAQKTRMVQERKIRQHDLLSPIALDERPFCIPECWEWTRLGTVCFLITDGAHHTPKYEVEGVPFLSVKDVSGGAIDFAGTRFISETAHRELCKRCKPEFGDILLTKVGTTGIAVTVDVDKEFSIFVSVALLKFSQAEIDRFYLRHLINSPFVKRQSADNTQGIGNKNLVLRLINQFLIPVPPLAEQRRIVAKVDELMSLCDQLEAQLATAQTESRRLLDAVLHEALAPTALETR
jgi:type I restriction enzyme S subunit